MAKTLWAGDNNLALKNEEVSADAGKAQNLNPLRKVAIATKMIGQEVF